MAAPVKAFREFPVVREAYTQARDHLDHIIKIENCPELGAIDPPLWLYIHSCVPEAFGLPVLRHAASGIGPRCKEMVMPLLISGQLDPDVYAATIRNTDRFDQFLKHWIARKPSSRVIAKKKIIRTKPEDNGQAAA